MMDSNDNLNISAKRIRFARNTLVAMSYFLFGVSILALILEPRDLLWLLEAAAGLYCRRIVYQIDHGLGYWRDKIVLK
jgi:hypothetical protein